MSASTDPVQPDGRAVAADVSAPHTLTLSEQAQALADGTLCSAELVQHCLSRIERMDPVLNSLLCTDAAGALEQAGRADAARASGQDDRSVPLAGLPLVHKDIFCTTGLPTTCGSRMLEGYRSPFAATAVSRLAAAGAITLGKANMDEFAMGSSGENSAFGATGNPWRDGTVPGGSSSGSAAAVAARLVPAATATDTGGSIRQPAAYCGITGIKPTYGRVSRYGMVAFASSFDQGGVVATSAEDCARVLGAMSGLDENDATSSEAAVPDWSAVLADGDARLDGLRVGVPETFFGDGLDEGVALRVREALAELESLGATLVPIELPNQRYGISAYYVIAPAEASSNLSRFDGVRFGRRCEAPVDLQDLYTRSRAEGFGAEVQRRILIGTHVLSAGYYDAYYRRAQQVRRLIADDFERAFAQVDLIAGPTAPGVAFERGSNVDDPVAMYLNDLYTVAANLCGLPALSAPCGFAHGLPVGLQLIGRAFDEGTLLHTAHRYQHESDWHRWMPTGAIS